ncbi:MAG: hypothetical protein AAGK14_09670 [Verrucomicrobiota bacterium]
MSFGTCLFFCQLILTPVTFGVLFLGWQGLVPELAPFVKDSFETAESMFNLSPIRGPGAEAALLLAVSFVYSLVVSLPLSFLFSSRG